ncbi:hypothetical protein H696_04720 [Fonticula alba]|uniref:Uncharacterized protein n=1 Tax=Fonticula alba TaxID=691883 RepID=A0A058Z2S8_FONAL|nr:hypothetical protein H696_04720 [Fonticula alba]KCV68426.1 hypothetical protein H696_04720 [Fonticula alba]|eukprot:XP_009496858.1 hypothetical protein H696_04720 [Fonticula alba]
MSSSNKAVRNAAGKRILSRNEVKKTSKKQSLTPQLATGVVIAILVLLLSSSIIQMFPQ